MNLFQEGWKNCLNFKLKIEYRWSDLRGKSFQAMTLTFFMENKVKVMTCRTSMPVVEHICAVKIIGKAL